MNNEQLKVATEIMINWLSHPNELGKAPSKIECAKTFELYDMTYYIFKYKKSFFGKWLLGVCGGFENDSLEYCGHVFSKMEEYNDETAIDDAKEIVEMIRQYWMEKAKEIDEKQTNENQEKTSKGVFLGFALLSEHKFNKEKFIQDFYNDWNITIKEDNNANNDNQTIVFSINDTIATVSLMPSPIPNNEAEHYAINNYLWPEAIQVAQDHKAHLVIAIIGQESPIERGKLFVKLLDTCCKQENVTGIVNCCTVFQPEMFSDFAKIMKEDSLPIFNWVWFGLYQDEETHRMCGYTYGLNTFGKDEIEIINADAQPSDIRDFLIDLVGYILEYDVTLNDGETIGFSETDKHAIIRSEGKAINGMTLKIDYNPL